jgi:hypothetical protein
LIGMDHAFLPLMPLTGGSVRGFLDQRGVDHRNLSERDATHLAYVLSGFVLTVPASSAPITALVWLASALTTGGRYEAPEIPGHRADLGDGGPQVDSVVLMAVIQRHFLADPRPGWTDERLARDLSLNPQDVTRAQHTLDVIARATKHPAALGARWWLSHTFADQP